MSMPKLHVFALAFTLATSASVPAAIAQAPARATPGFDVEARLSELAGRLSLDARQTERVRAILESARARMEALRQGAAVERHQDLRLRRRQILWDVEDQIWALLSCAQKDAFRLYVRERSAARMERMTHERGAGPGHGPGGRRPPHGRGR